MCQQQSSRQVLALDECGQLSGARPENDRGQGHRAPAARPPAQDHMLAAAHDNLERLLGPAVKGAKLRPIRRKGQALRPVALGLLQWVRPSRCAQKRRRNDDFVEQEERACQVAGLRPPDEIA